MTLSDEEKAEIRAMVATWPEPTPAQRAELVSILTEGVADSNAKPETGAQKAATLKTR